MAGIVMPTEPGDTEESGLVEGTADVAGHRIEGGAANGDDQLVPALGLVALEALERSVGDALRDQVEAVDEFGDLAGLEDSAAHVAAASNAQVKVGTRPAGVGVAREPAVDVQDLTVDAGFHTRCRVLVLVRSSHSVGSHPRRVVPDGHLSPRSAAPVTPFVG